MIFRLLISGWNFYSSVREVVFQLCRVFFCVFFFLKKKKLSKINYMDAFQCKGS